MATGTEDYSDSEDEGMENTVGDIPMWWYEDYDHVGYDRDAKKIMKSTQGKDSIDSFLARTDDPNFFRTVYDEKHDREVVLTKDDIQIIQNILDHKFEPGFDPYEIYPSTFGEPSIHPVTNKPEPKRRFVPSKWEAQRVARLVKALRKGWIKLEKPEKKPSVYMLWKDDDQADQKRLQNHIPAPKLKLPGHNASYNPPEEYILAPETVADIMNQDPETRPKFIPSKYDALRKVPAYSKIVDEAFERCLDLYLAPRTIKMKKKPSPDSLLPDLPKPAELKPFPTEQCISYIGHNSRVRSISVHPEGQWLASGGDDSTLRMWEVQTGRCWKIWTLTGSVKAVSWNPNPSLHIICAAVTNTLYIINADISETPKDEVEQLLSLGEEHEAVTSPKWELPNAKEQKIGIKLKITYESDISKLTWHHKGDYLLVFTSKANRGTVFIHQLTKKSTQRPFKKTIPMLTNALFHPSKPHLIVSTQVHIYIYNLLKQSKMKKLVPPVKWISSLAIHPGGDNLIIGSYDKKICWFDLDMGEKPYKTIRHHKKAVRAVAYHNRYPLFASSSDDGNVTVFHGRVFNDLVTNPLIVPVKILKGHSIVHSLGVLDVVFHPTQPWVFTAGADKTIRLFN